MANETNPIQYENFHDLMTSRYEFTEEEIRSLTKRYPNLSDYINIDLMNKLDILEFFNVTKEKILENPKFLFKNANILINKCKLAYILGFEPTTEYLNSYFNIRLVLSNMKAIDKGELPQNTNVFSPVKATSGFANYNDSESYLRRNKVGGVNWEINDRFKTLFPELSAELDEYFPQFAYNQEKSIKYRKLSDKEQTRIKVKNKVKELWANNKMMGRSKPVKIDFSRDGYENIVYSTRETTRASHPIEMKKEKTVETVAPKQFVVRERTSKLSENQSIEVKPYFTQSYSATPESSSQFSTMRTESNLAKYEQLYQIPYNELERKLKFYCDEFGFTEKEFFWKLSKSSIFVTTSDERVLNAKNVLESEVGFLGDVLHKYVLYTGNFPCIEKSISQIKAKVEMLNNMGVTNENLSINFNILKRNINDLELRLKLAFINDLPIEIFLKDGHYISPSVIWSRMKAFEAGILKKDKFYDGSNTFENTTNYKAGELIDMFPLSEEDIEEINKKYEALVNQGKTWRNSYKFSLKNQANLENKNLEPKSLDTEESKNLIKEIKSFAESDSELDDEFEDLNTNLPSIETKGDITLKIMNLFDCSITEAEKLIKKHPRLISLDFNRVNELKQHLLAELNITSDDFAQAIKVNPSLVRKTIKQFDAYKTFLSDYLLLDKSQIKQAITHSGNAIIKDPEDILEKTYIFARTLKIPFKRASQIFIESPAAYQGKIDKLEERLETLLSLGINKEILVSNLNIASCTNKNVKIKYMLAKLNGLSDEEFLKRNYFINEAKVYARTMFNLTYNQEIPVYDSEKRFKQNLEAEFSHLEHMPSFVTEDEPSLALKELYPFGAAQKKQIENLYNTKFHKNPLKLNEEELEYGV